MFKVNVTEIMNWEAHFLLPKQNEETDGQKYCQLSGNEKDLPQTTNYHLIKDSNAQIFQKPRCHSRILDARRVTRNKLHTENPKRAVATVKT
jgi:hypothetical protein